MKRTVRPDVVEQSQFDMPALIRSIMFLDAALKRGVVVGVEDDKVVIDDKQVLEAIKPVRDAIDALAHDLERLGRAIARSHPVGSHIMQ